MAIRGVALTVTYTAWDTVNQGPKIGDAANHTIKVIKDGTEATATNNGSIVEVGSTTSPGEYKITITSTEMLCDFITIAGKSTTVGIVIIPVKITTEHGVLPTTQQGNAGAVVTSGTGTGQLSVSSGLAALSASGVSSVKDESNTYDLRQMITMIWEICMSGKISGLPLSPAVLRNFADANDRATIAFDANNNRTTITINHAP